MSKLRALVLLLALCWTLGTLGCSGGTERISPKEIELTNLKAEPTKAPPTPPAK